MNSQEVQVKTGAVVFSTPLVGQKFESAEVAAKAYADHLQDVTDMVPKRVNEAYRQVTESENSKFYMKAVLATALAFGVGYVVLQFLGMLIAASAAFGIVGLTAWWWKFKLPGQIARAQYERMLEIKKAYNDYVEAAKAEEIRHLEKLKSQAEANPIETLEIDLQRMFAERDALKTANTALRTQEMSLAEDLAKGKNENPGADFSEQEQQLKDFKAVCDADDAELRDFINAITQTEEVLKEARIKWNFAVKLDAALAQRDAARGNEVQRRILKETALDTIRQRHAKLFARMHTRAVELSASKTINVAGVKIDVSNVRVPLN